MTVSCPPLIEVTCDACTAHTISCAKLVIHLQNISFLTWEIPEAQSGYTFSTWEFVQSPCRWSSCCMSWSNCKAICHSPLVPQAPMAPLYMMMLGTWDSPTSHNIQIKERFTAGPQMIQWYNPWTTTYLTYSLLEPLKITSHYLALYSRESQTQHFLRVAPFVLWSSAPTISRSSSNLELHGRR